MPFIPQRGLGSPGGPQVIRGTRRQIRSRVVARRAAAQAQGQVDGLTGSAATGLSDEEHAAEVAAAQQAAIDQARENAAQEAGDPTEDE